MIIALVCAGLAVVLIWMVLKPSPTGTCTCGHDGEGHKHYRSGTDCAWCGCRRFTRRK